LEHHAALIREYAILILRNAKDAGRNVCHVRRLLSREQRFWPSATGSQTDGQSKISQGLELGDSYRVSVTITDQVNGAVVATSGLTVIACCAFFNKAAAWPCCLCVTAELPVTFCSDLSRLSASPDLCSFMSLLGLF